MEIQGGQTPAYFRGVLFWRVGNYYLYASRGLWEEINVNDWHDSHIHGFKDDSFFDVTKITTRESFEH